MNSTLTTTNIGKSELKSLRSLAKTHNLKQVEFINHAIAYFKKTGINPSDQIFSPREEINKLSTRMDQVIGFKKTQEEKKLNPLLDELILISRRLNDQIEDQITIEHLGKLYTLMMKIMEEEKNGQEFNSKEFEKIINGINKLPRYLLEIEKRQELTNKFQENLFTAQKNKTRLGSFQQSDIEAFNQLSKQLNNSIND
ncbi:MAG: hypothetical protein GX677_01140 [Treponema sp.]|nr:hypothetical protein [Treponema sp.]